MSAIQRWEKLYEKFKHLVLKTDKDNFKADKIHLQKIIGEITKSYFQELLDKNRNKPKELWKALKSLGINLDKASKLINQYKKVVQFNSKQFFDRFYSELAGDAKQKLPKASN